MVTKIEDIPDELLAKVEETAAREGIFVPDLGREALELRVDSKGFAGVYAIARRRAQRNDIPPKKVERIAEAEIASHRNKRER